MKHKPIREVDIVQVFRAYNWDVPESNLQSLDAYLGAIYKLYKNVEYQQITGQLILNILKAAETTLPVTFEEQWHDVHCPDNQKEISDYARAIQYLEYMMADYQRMKKEWKKTPLRAYQGMYHYHSPKGHSWYYFDVSSIIANYEYVLEMDDEINKHSFIEEKMISWMFIPNLLRFGVCYEY